MSLSENSEESHAWGLLGGARIKEAAAMRRISSTITASPASHHLASALPRQERGLSQFPGRLPNY